MTEIMLVTIIAIGTIVVLGGINNIRKIVLYKNKTNFIVEYCEQLGSFPNLQTSDETREVITYLVRYASDAKNDMNESPYDSPITDVIKYLENDVLTQEFLEKKTKKICFNAMRAAHEYEKCWKKHCWYFINPFILFYQGVELTMLIVFGYPIRFIKADFDFEGELWNKIVGGISIIGGLASIIALGMEICKII